MSHFLRRPLRTLCLAWALCAGVLAPFTCEAATNTVEEARLLDNHNETEWPAYGRTYGEQHFSPLSQVNLGTVNTLGLSWSIDLDRKNPATLPVEVNGVLYFATGYSVVQAVDAVTGNRLWRYDSKVVGVAGAKLAHGWGSRGIAYWNGKIYTATLDGRLIAIDAKTGQPLWSVMTVEPNDGRFITGAPRVLNGRVIIGHGGADWADVRAYVTTYDAETGKQLWRFFLTPGSPAQNAGDATQEMAARTWSGEWWKYGGGGTAWNAFSYDPETDTVFIGTGNGAPWNWKIRSQGKGDNLFVCSIVALNASTGAYKWHYQVNPGETWDYTAVMDMHLAELPIKGQLTKVLIQAPKNGFLYVINATTGALISATRIAKVTWASGIDSKSGRPIENPGARYPNGSDFELWPGPQGAHSWMPSAFSPKEKLVVIPTLESGQFYNDRGVDLKGWKRRDNATDEYGVNVGGRPVTDPLQGTGWLMAVDPIKGEIKWKVQNPEMFDGGVLATAGGLVFQGDGAGYLNAYELASGKKVWSFDARAAIVSAPITYSVGGRQYITVIVGASTGMGTYAYVRKEPVDYYTQARRVLTFTLGGNQTLPPRTPFKLAAIADSDYQVDAALAARGAAFFDGHCMDCHGILAIAGGIAPDLRASAIPQNAAAFESVVRGGALLSGEMPRFDRISDDDLRAVRQYLRSRAADLRAGSQFPRQ